MMLPARSSHFAVRAAVICLAGLALATAPRGVVSQEPPPIDVASLDYEGHAPDASWREAAEERIEQIRKGDLTIDIVDGDGKSIEGAEVSVRMKKHAFHFGTQVQVDLICDDSPTGEAYRRHFLEMFNYATVNSFYYMRWRTPRLAEATREKTIRTVEWMRGHDIATRGHVLVWYLKDENIDLDDEALRRLVLDHIEMKAGDSTIAPGIDEWDVQNEPYRNSDIFKRLGEESIAEWFEVTRRLDPTAKLFLNEAGLISRTDQPTWRERQDFTFDLVRDLQSRGAPIDGLGLQSHHVGSLAGITDVLEGLERFGRLGLELQITEYDIKLIPAIEKGGYRAMWRAPSPTSPELQALEGDYMRDFLTACFSSPHVTAFVMWGFWDGRHWLYNAPLYNEDWTLRPAGRAWRDLVFDTWWTNVQDRSDARGRFTTRGFLGRYEVNVTCGGRQKSATFVLEKGGTHLRVVLP